MPTNYESEPEEEYAFPDPTELPHGVRFGEGQPINLRGRPKGAPNRATIAKRVAAKRHRVLIDGRVRRKSIIELVLLAVRNAALKGDYRALKLQDKFTNLLAPQIDQPRGVLITAETLEVEEWEALACPSISADFVKEKYPYLLDAKLRELAYHEKIERQVEENKGSSGLYKY